MDTQIKNPKIIRIKLPKQRIISLNACNNLQLPQKPMQTVYAQKTPIIKPNNIVKQRTTIVRREDVDNNVCYFEVFDHSIGKENSDAESPTERVYVTPQIPMKKEVPTPPKKAIVVQNLRVYTDNSKKGINTDIKDIRKKYGVDKHEMMIQKTYNEIMTKNAAKKEIQFHKKYELKREYEAQNLKNIEQVIQNTQAVSEEDIQNECETQYKYQTQNENEILYEDELKTEPEIQDEYETHYEYVTQPECKTEYEENEIQEETVATKEVKLTLQAASSNQDFEETMDTFFISNNIPDKVSIVKNEEKVYSDQDAIVDNTQNDTECETQEDTEESVQISDQNLFQIVTDNGTLLLHNNGVVQELIKNGQLIINNEDQGEAQEIVVCEGEALDGKEFLLEYVEEKKEVETISCNICDAIFENLQEFEEHQLIHRDDTNSPLLPPPESYHCYCGEKFKDLKEFETHHNKHKTNFNIPITGRNQKHKCNFCNKIFITASLLTNHMISHEAKAKNKKGAYRKEPKLDEPVLCEICAKPFVYKSALRIHRKRHEEGKKYSCDLCGKRFGQRISLRKHRFTHINPVTCSHCDLIFRDKDVFEIHKVDGVCPMETAKELIQRWKQEAVTEEDTLVGYVCAVCNTFVSTEEELEQHIMTTHILDSNTLFCFECGEKASSKAELQAHIMTHVQVYNKRISCKVCGVLCESKATLAVHQRVHTNERPFECPNCSQTFKTKIHMQSHQLVHTKEKKHACPICNKCFALKGNMQAHLRGHTGEKPYVCPLCKAAFKDTKILKKHKLMLHQDSDMPWGLYLKVSKTRPSNLALTRSHDY